MAKEVILSGPLRLGSVQLCSAWSNVAPRSRTMVYILWYIYSRGPTSLSNKSEPRRRRRHSRITALLHQSTSVLPTLSLAYLRSRMRTDFFSRNGPLNLQISISLDATIALRGETKKGCGLWVVDRIGIRSVTYRRRVAYFYKM